MDAFAFKTEVQKVILACFLFLSSSKKSCGHHLFPLSAELCMSL